MSRGQHPGYKRGWKCIRGSHALGPCALVPRWWNLWGMLWYWWPR